MERHSNIQGTVFAIIFSVIFLLFLNGTIGSILLASTVGMSVISLVLTLLSRKHVQVSVYGISGTVECGRNVNFEVVVEKAGFCFAPFVEVCISPDTGSAQSIRVRTSLLFRKSAVVKGSFSTSRSGLCDVTVKNIVLSDFMNNFHFENKIGLTMQVAVLPQMIDYDGPQVFPNMLPSDDEETEEGVSVLQGNMPGYEHREYAPGDSPRRVNYKLSAKRGRLMVRLDESNGCASTNIEIADNAMSVCCDKAFALARLLVNRGGTARITYKGEQCTAATPETLDRMREWLAYRRFSGEFVPQTYEMAKDTAVLFSGNGQVVVQK